MKANRRRILLVGSGRWARVIQRELETRAEIEIVTTADTSPDAVIVASGASKHVTDFKKYVELGVPIWLEKPAALNLADTVMLNELALHHNSRVLVNHIYLFHPAYQELKRALGAGETIEFLSSTGGNHGPWREDCDSLWDYGPHDLAMILDLINEEPYAVEAAESGGNWSVNLKFTSALAEAHFGNGFPGRVRNLKVKTGRHEMTFTDSGGGGPDGPLAHAVSAFLKGISGTFDERWGLSLSIKIARVLETVSRQAPLSI